MKSSDLQTIETIELRNECDPEDRKENKVPTLAYLYLSQRVFFFLCTSGASVNTPNYR